MDRKPTTEELRAFHGYTKPKRTKKSPIVECQLIDQKGYIHARGDFSLCAALKRKMGGHLLTIKIIRQSDIKPSIYMKAP